MSENDPLLQPLLRARSHEQREACLEALLAEHAYARIDRALDARYRQSGLSPAYRDDVRADVLLRLVKRLHALVQDPDDAPVTSFCDYVAVIAFNTFDSYLRRMYPLRSKLKNRIRYALRHDPRLAEWEREGQAIAGLSTWDEQERRGVQPLVDSLDLPECARHSPNDLRPLLVVLLERAGRPVALHVLVSAIAELHHVNEIETAPQTNIVDALANTSYLQQVWTEIEALPVNQRVALLLNARDAAGDSVVRFLPVTGIASGRQISDTLEIDLGALADLWNDLPLDDVRIAGMLEVTRQQVINLRQAARNRLARRLRKETTRGRRGS